MNSNLFKILIILLSIIFLYFIYNKFFYDNYIENFNPSVCLNSCPDGWTGGLNVCFPPRKNEGPCSIKTNFNGYDIKDRQNWAKYCSEQWTSCKTKNNLCNIVNLKKGEGIEYNTKIYIKNIDKNLFLGSCGKQEKAGYKNIYPVQAIKNDPDGYITDNLDQCTWIIKKKNNNLKRKLIHFNDYVIIELLGKKNYILGTHLNSNCGYKPDRDGALLENYMGLNKYYWKIVGNTGNERGPIRENSKIFFTNRNSFLNICGYEKTNCKYDPSIIYKITTNKSKQSGLFDDSLNKNIVWNIKKHIEIPERTRFIKFFDYIIYKNDVSWCFFITDNKIMENNTITIGPTNLNGYETKQEWIYKNGFIYFKYNDKFCITVKDNIIKNNQEIVLKTVSDKSNIDLYNSQQWLFKNNVIYLKKDPTYCLTLKINRLVYKNNIVLYKYSNTNNINDPLYISQKWIVPNETLEYDKCRNISGWFKPNLKTFIRPDNNYKINGTYPNMIESICFNKCSRDKNCDFYTINPINKHCSLYSLNNNSSIKYSSKNFGGSKGFGEIKNKSICNNNTIVEEEKNPEVNKSLCGKCAFPKFKDKCYISDFGCDWQKCCPKGWNNSLYGAQKGKSCGAPYLYNKDTYDLWGDIVNNCLDANGTIELVDVKPNNFICKLKK